MVHEARAVAHALTDGPPVAGVRVRRVLGPDRPHPVHARVVGSFAIPELVESRVVEDQRPRIAVDLDREVARPSHGGSRHLEHAAGPSVERQER